MRSHVSRISVQAKVSTTSQKSCIQHAADTMHGNPPRESGLSLSVFKMLVLTHLRRQANHWLRSLYFINGICSNKLAARQKQYEGLKWTWTIVVQDMEYSLWYS